MIQQSRIKNRTKNCSGIGAMNEKQENPPRILLFLREEGERRREECETTINKERTREKREKGAGGVREGAWRDDGMHLWCLLGEGGEMAGERQGKSSTLF